MSQEVCTILEDEFRLLHGDKIADEMECHTVRSAAAARTGAFVTMVMTMATTWLMFC